MKRTGIKRGTGLKPGKPLTRSAPLSSSSRPGRGAPIKPANRKRKREAYARNFGPEADAVRAMPCVISGALGCEPAHDPSRGAGGGRFDMFPLRPDLHSEQHRIGIKSFAAKYGIDPRKAADRVAIGHASPLGIRGVAQRWAAFEDAGNEQLDTYEWDALMGCVRREMEREVERRSTGQVGEDEPSFAWRRKALAHRIMQALGAPFTEDTHGEHGLAWTLCEAAGWPS